MSTATKSSVSFYKPLAETIQSLVKTFEGIAVDRKTRLKELTNFIQTKSKRKEQIDLLFICTHNSRRSHIAQIWGQAAAAYYAIANVRSYSGGTETTAFNPRAVKAMQKAGFKINASREGTNPAYTVTFSDDANAVVAFSKKYDSESNPQKEFAAVMTCSHADETCPVVLGMETKISLPFNDPKDFDGTPLESEKYTASVKEIGAEILYAFSQVKLNI